MDWMYLLNFLPGALLLFGARVCGRGEWNREVTSLKQTRALLGITALIIILHHLAQKTSAPWLPQEVIVHGLDLYPFFGYPLVAVFLFCSGLGLYKSVHEKKDYLKHSSAGTSFPSRSPIIFRSSSTPPSGS